MNIENIDRVIAAIKGESELNVGFNMGWWSAPVTDHTYGVKDRTGRNCDTAACIGGWCNLLEGVVKPGERAMGNMYEEQKAAQFLGLTGFAAHTLFFPDEHNEEVNDYEKIPPERAIAVLEHLKATGTVDWSITP